MYKTRFIAHTENDHHVVSTVIPRFIAHEVKAGKRVSKTRTEKWNAAVAVLQGLWNSAEERRNALDDKESDMTDAQLDDYDDCEAILALDIDFSEMGI